MTRFAIAMLAVLIVSWAVITIDRAWSDIARLEQQLGDTKRMLDVVTAERAAAELRARRASTAREAILSAPDADNAPVAPVLRRALEAADEIGGLHE